VELVGRRGAGLECTSSSDSELAERFDGTVAGLGCGAGVAGEHRTSSRLGIDRVGRAAASPVVTVRLVDLDHPGPAGPQMPGQSRTPRAGAFDPDRQHLPEAGDPAGQPPLAANRGRERRRLQQPADLVEHDRHMDVFVGVDTGNDTQVVAICDGGHAAPSCDVGWGGTHGRDAGQDREQARSHRRLFGHVHPTGCASGRARSLGRQVRSRTPKGVWPTSESDQVSETQPAS
jgi:hypothetical protein